MKTERRYQPAGDELEIRQDQNGNISGYAAVFYNAEDRGSAFGLLGWVSASELNRYMKLFIFCCS